jgi:predicted nucleic acid-binding protein
VTVAYLDTSALAKLAIAEAETEALRAWLADHQAPVATSALAAVELRRAARRHSHAAARAAEQILAGVDHISIGLDVITGAAAIDPPSLRTLDAIHLATALLIGPSLAAFVAYDTRLVDAARTAGLPIHQPS